MYDTWYTTAVLSLVYHDFASTTDGTGYDNVFAQHVVALWHSDASVISRGPED